jgi:hypothetical protein
LLLRHVFRRLLRGRPVVPAAAGVVDEPHLVVAAEAGGLMPKFPCR